jgi:hypothetical protein
MRQPNNVASEGLSAVETIKGDNSLPVRLGMHIQNQCSEHDQDDKWQMFEPHFLTIEVKLGVSARTLDAKSIRNIN